VGDSLKLEEGVVWNPESKLRVLRSPYESSEYPEYSELDREDCRSMDEV
jgi:hypothetical protein